MRFNNDRHTYIFFIYTPNTGLRIAVFNQEREHGRFGGSTGGALGEQQGSTGAQQRNKGSSSSC